MSRFWIGLVIGLVLAGVAAWVICCGLKGPRVEAKEMQEITIKVDSKLRPKIPFARIPSTPNHQDPNHGIRTVSFKTAGGTAAVIIPVEGKVINPQSEDVSPPSRVSVLHVDEEGATLVITEKNRDERTVEYQVLCDDGTTRYWAEGQSPPRIIIPKW